MTMPNTIDLVLSVFMLFHVLYCQYWDFKHKATIRDILNHPFRNDIVTSALRFAIPLFIFGLLGYGVVIWRFYEFMTVIGGAGTSLIILTVFISLISVFKLGQYFLFTQMIVQANYKGFK